MNHRTRLYIGSAITGLFVVIAILGPLLAPENPNAIHLARAFESPSPSNLLGRDELGRDLLSRTLYGARLAFLISVLGVGAGAVVGSAAGLWAGYVGGIAERAVMRCIDILLSFPGFLLALVAATAVGPGTLNLIVAVGFFSFPAFARVTRAIARSLRREEYVSAARTLGAGHGYILRRHILVNAWSSVASICALRMAQAIATASGLSFLGLGPPLPTADWGTMIDMGREYLWIEPRLVLVPGVAIAVSSFGFYLLGDALSEAGVLD